MRRPVAVVALLLALCGARGRSEGRTRTLPEWAESAAAAPREDQAGEDAVVLLKDWTLTVDNGVREGIHRRVVAVQTEEGRSDAALFLSRGPFHDARDVRVWVRQPSGRVSVFDEGDGTLFRGASEKLLIDVQLLSVEPPTITPGSIVAAEYRFHSSADVPQDILRIQENAPVLLARVHAESRGGWKIVSKVTGGPNPGPAETATPGDWVFRDLPGLGEPAQPWSPEPPAVELALDYAPASGADPFRDWHDVAQWGLRLFDEARSESPSLARLVSGLPQGGTDLLEAAGAAARRLRYFGIELGWGGYRPRDVETTLTRGFGDCKDKSLLLVSALRERGVDAIPILAMAPSDGYLADDLPGPLQFNHAIVGIPWHGADRPRGLAIVDAPGVGPLRLYDPTLSDASAQDVPIQLEGGAGLALHPATSGLIRMPKSSPEENRIERSIVWTIAPDGSAKVRQEVSHQGATRRWLESGEGERIRPEDLRKREVASAWARCPSYQSLEVGPLAPQPDGSWRYSVSFDCPEPFSVADALRLLDLPVFQAPTTFPIPRSKKPQTLHQSFLYSRRERTEIAYPGLTLLAAPPAFEEAASIGRVAVRVEKAPERLVLVREVALTGPEIPPDKQPEGARLRAALRRANQATLIFEGPLVPRRGPDEPRPSGPVEELKPIEHKP